MSFDKMIWCILYVINILYVFLAISDFSLHLITHSNNHDDHFVRVDERNLKCRQIKFPSYSDE